MNREEINNRFEEEFPDIFHLPEGGMSVWLEKSYTNQLKDFLHQEIDRAVAEREKEIVEKVVKIIDDNDPQTDNKVSPKYWGATLRRDILSLLTKKK